MSKEITVLYEDTRQNNRSKSHDLKHKYFEEQGIKVIRTKLAVADYSLPTDQSIVIDTKQNISELYSNCIQQHDRFKREVMLAQEIGAKLIVLVENKDGVTKVDDLSKWKNPQMYKFWRDKKASERKGVPFTRKPPASNTQLKKILWTMNKKYGVEFQFCKPEEAGAKIIELLGGVTDG